MLTAEEKEALLYCVGLIHRLTNSYEPPDIVNDKALSDRAFDKACIARTALSKVPITGA